VGKPQFLTTDPPSSPPERQEEPDETVNIPEVDEPEKNLIDAPGEPKETADVVPGTTYEENEAPGEEAAQGTIPGPLGPAAEWCDADTTHGTAASENGDALIEPHPYPSEASIDPGLPAAQLAAEEEFFRRSTATNASVEEDGHDQADQDAGSIDVQDYLTSDAFIDAPTVTIASDVTESEFVDASQEIVQGGQDQGQEIILDSHGETEVFVAGTKAVECTTGADEQDVAETPIEDRVHPTASTKVVQQNDHITSPEEISRIANSVADCSPATANKAMPKTRLSKLSQTPNSEAQSVEDDDLSQSQSQGRKRPSTGRLRGRPSKRPKSATPSQAETRSDVLARTPDVDAEKPLLDCIVVATPELLRQRGTSSTPEARRAIPLKPSRPANASSSRPSLQPRQLHERAASVEVDASPSVTSSIPKKRRSGGSLLVNADETGKGYEKTQQDVQVEQTPTSKRQKSDNGTPRSAHKKRSSQILSHVEITSSGNSFGSLENGQQSRASSAEAEFTREEVAEVGEVVLGSRTPPHPRSPAVSETAALPAPATPSPATTPTATRTILSPRSLLRNLNTWISDLKTMVLGSREEREFDDVLFEARRAVHEAGRRGRGG